MEYTIVAKPDGTIEVVPITQNNNLPFNVGERLFNEFNMAGSSTPPLDAFKNTVAPRGVNTGITASSAVIPFENDPVAIAQGFTKDTPSDTGTNFQFLSSANEADEADEVIDTRSGIAKLLEFLQRFSPIAAVGRGLESLRNRFDTRKAIQRNIQRDTQGDITTFDLDKIRNRQRIMNMQPTAQDIARGDRGRTTTSRRTSPQGGMQAERTRSRDLGRMRGGVGR